MKDKTLLKQFSMIAILEGISYLLLLGIAMPMKYFAGNPDYVYWLGRVHGGLTIAFIIWILLCHSKYKWTYRFSIKGFILSLLPFGAFIFDKELKAQI